MNNIIDLSKPVAETIKEHPEVKEILVDFWGLSHCQNLPC